MPAIVEALEYTVDKLRATGIKATTEAEHLQIPGAWVTLDAIETKTLAGTRIATVTIFLIASNPRSKLAIAVLDEMAMKAEKALYIDSWQADAVALPNHAPDPLPALSGTLTLEVS